MPERGSRLGMAILRQVMRFGGMGALRVALAPVVLYYVIADRAVRTASRDYLSRLARYCDANGIARPMPGGLAGVYRHVFSFALSMAEKVRAWEGVGAADVVLGAPEISRRLVESPGGSLLLVSHLGNFDIAIAHGAFATARRYRILIDFAATRRFNSERIEALLHDRVVFHDAGRFGPEVAVALKQAVRDGEIVVIAADRLGRNEEASVETTFLGARTRLPVGPWVLAHLLACPVYAVFACREGRSYRLLARLVASRVDLSDRARRHESLRTLARSYAECIEELVVRYPEQWYNFYPYWHEER